MSYEATGTIQTIGPIQTFGSKGFTKREVVLSIPDGKYPQTVAFEFQGERVDLPDKYNEGDEITVTFDLKGRLHEASGRTYNTLNAWKVSGISSAKQEAKAPQQSARPANKPAQADHDLGKDDSGKDYPF